MTDQERAARHDPIYDRLHATPEFVELRRRYRGFVFPATVAFLAWYLLYVVLSTWATDLAPGMATPPGWWTTQARATWAGVAWWAWASSRRACSTGSARRRF